MAAEFNYERAWRELAEPEHKKLCAEATALYDHIAEFGQERQQNAALDVPIPDELKPRFEAIPAYALAVAARVIYFWGHWAHPGDVRVVYKGEQPRLLAEMSTLGFTRGSSRALLAEMSTLGFPVAAHDSHQQARQAAQDWIKNRDCRGSECDDWVIEIAHNGPSSEDGGAYWKFSSMADQVLRQRLGLPPSGRGYKVYQGQLRRESQNANYDIGWATPDMLARAEHGRTLWPDEGWDQVRDGLIADDPHRAWFYTDQFMDHVEGTSYDTAELPRLLQPVVDEHFKVLSVNYANHKPHPFLITPQHFDNGVVNPDKAPCGIRDCILSYSEHKSDKVVFLQCKHDVAKSEAEACLLALKPFLKEHSCAGVAFVEHPEGWKIVDDEE